MRRLEWEGLARVGDRVKMSNPQYMEIINSFPDEYCYGWECLRGKLVEIDNSDSDWVYERVQWDGDSVTRNYLRGFTTHE